MKVQTLQLEQRGWFTHKAVITHEDLTETADNTAQVLELVAVDAGDVVQDSALHLVTPFKDASDSAYNTNAVTLGDGGSANRFISSTEINENGTEILSKAGTLTTSYAYVAADTVDLTVNGLTGKALADIDVGELWVFLRIAKMASL
jgi:hypothetical protein